MEKYVVFSDLHGRHELLENCLKKYGQDVAYVSNGDAINSPRFGNAKKSVQLLLDIGAVGIYGNHEWTLSASINEPSEEERGLWVQHIWPHYHRHMLGAYGLKDLPLAPKTNQAMESMKNLKEAIYASGHNKFYENLKFYHETDEFLAIHAGISSHVPWHGTDGQKERLDNLSVKSTSQVSWSSGPVQVFDTPGFDLSNSLEVPEFFDKVLITGHSHTSEKADTRVTDNGKRVRLAGELVEESPLFVWESWTCLVVPIHPNTY